MLKDILDNQKDIINNNFAKFCLLAILTIGVPTWGAWNGLNVVVPQTSTIVLANGQKTQAKNDWADLIKFVIMAIFASPALAVELLVSLFLVATYNNARHGSITGRKEEK